MATMVKEPKRREKKRVKEKSAPRISTETEQPSILCDTKDTENIATTSKTAELSHKSPEKISYSEQTVESLEQGIETGTEDLNVTQISTDQDLDKLKITDQSSITEETLVSKQNIESVIVNFETKSNEGQSVGDTYHDINVRLERISIPSLDPNLNLEDIQNRLENPQAYMRLDKMMEAHLDSQEHSMSRAQSQELEQVAPSAPVLEEPKTTRYFQQPEEIVVSETKTKPQCMQLEEAIKLFGGTEMERVRVISEKEEAIVEAGPMCGPEHPLVDLLSTFRSSLIAVDRERLQLAKDYRDEESHRNKLWKVEQRTVRASEQCKCGATVSARVTFDHAELNYAAMPAARLRLERLKRDMQDSFCHHLHEALFTHCQIDELISETVKGHKKEIREAMALVLQALRRSDSAPESLGAALQRWAAALSAALLDNRDISQLIHLLHHLFRQSRSVRWAAGVVRSYVRAGDRSEAAAAVGLLDLLLARTHLEPAVECDEDAEESWEEMDKFGSGAVCDGALRERDLLELLRAFPMRDLVARIVLFTHDDVRLARAQEWGAQPGGGGGGGGGVLRACCGARALLHSLQRGAHAHPAYTRLHAVVKGLAVSLLHALAGLHLHSSDYYTKELEEKISAELEACYCAGAALLGEQLQDVPATLLSGQAAREYCCVITLALHDKGPKQLDFLAMTLPAMDCAARVGLVTQAALDRSFDHELAHTVMDFLLQTALRRRAAQCGGACAEAARAQLPRLLHAHAYLHALALHTLTEHHQVEPLDQSAIPALAPQWWRPTPGEARQLLDDWDSRCPHLIQHLLLQLDYTPHSGISLETQLVILQWLSGRQPAPPPEWAWSVARRARTHRSWWAAPADAPPPEPPPTDLFGKACAVLASSWGHSIPLICSAGVSALAALARARPADAAHCLAPVMALMAHSPESVALTPKFDELFDILLRAGPTVVQRALGWGPEPTAATLLRLILAQLEGDHSHATRSALVSAWLHALWKPALPARALVEAILLVSRDWLLFDAHATRMMQDEKSPELVVSAVEGAAVAPLACACVLRARAGSEARAGGALLAALHMQRARGGKINVDNAIKDTGGRTRSCDLALYRCGEALLRAPAQGPAHLTLWALFLHLYLQRPPAMSDTAPPTGPLFYSGFSKSRTLVQLMRKLQEVIMYHQNEAEKHRKNHVEAPVRPQNTNTRSKQTKNVPEDGVLPSLNIRDLLGESSDSSDSESDVSEETSDARNENNATEKKEDLEMLIKYHKAAEDMCKSYLRWLDEGDKTSAMSHHAEIARFIPEQVLAAAWARELAQRRPPPAADEPPPTEPPPPPLPTPFQAAVARILAIKDHSRKRSRRLSIRSPLEDLDMRDARSLLAFVNRYLADVTTLAEEWRSDVARLTALDGALLELVSRLRVGRPLPAQRQRCANKCSPVTLYPQGTNWTISSDAERGIEENRRAARALTRRLARPRPHAARSAAALLTIARRVSSVETAHCVCERAWACARAADQCAPATTTLTALVEQLADRWLCHNVKVCSELITRWGGNNSSALQQQLCGALVSPRRLPAPHWPPVYCAVLRSRLPAHIIFSYLSKFEMSRWAAVGEAALRRELLEAAVSAAQGFGLEPHPECHVLLELLGVHTAALLNPAEVCAHVTRCAHASITRELPPAYWPHVTRAAEQHACDVPFDQLGHLLRSLGALWWETRSQLAGEGGRYSAYAQPTAGLLQALTAAFTAAATALSYAPQRGEQLAGEGGRYSAYAQPTAGLLQALTAAFTAAATALSYAPQRGEQLAGEGGRYSAYAQPTAGLLQALTAAFTAAATALSYAPQRGEQLAGEGGRYSAYAQPTAGLLQALTAAFTAAATALSYAPQRGEQLAGEGGRYSAHAQPTAGLLQALTAAFTAAATALSYAPQRGEQLAGEGGRYSAYAQPTAGLLQALTAAFTAAATALSYAPQRGEQLAGEGGRYSAHAQPTAGLLQALTAAFTAAATALSYAPQRVALYVWSALQEAWGPWVAPHPSPLLQAEELHATMLKLLVHTIKQVMAQCPGIEEDLLQKVFEWVVQTAGGARAAPAQARVQLSALLAETGALAWTSVQWMHPQILHIALQACSSDNRELQSWCSAAWRCIAAETWVRGAAEQQIAPLLASLLYLFTAMQQHEETIEQAVRLPWWLLPEPALVEALERYFAQHHDPAAPYHELPHFRVVLYASELCIHSSHPPPTLHTHAARSKRGACVSRWTLCACALTLAQHASGHATHMLQTLAGIAPHLERSVGEIEELLSRALAVMCMEPAASKALPVWCEWVRGEGSRLAGACVSAAGTLTVLEAFAKLADAAIRAHCSQPDNGGWPAVRARLASTPWREAHALAARGRLHAAYAVARAHQQTHADMQQAFRALASADINYIENEPIFGVWLCVACRLARAGADAGGEGAESGAAARALLERAGAEPRRNLLKIVTMQADSGSPTPRHRLLARLALCLVSPSEGALRNYQASCAAVPGSSSDALAWGAAPKPIHLPRLAMRVFPNDGLLFKDELDLAPEYI